MIKAISSDGHTLILGLSHRNIERLKAADQPLVTNMSDLGLPGLTIVIIAGPTEEQIEAQLEPLLRPSPSSDG
jgi:hypothetical protein